MLPLQFVEQRQFDTELLSRADNFAECDRAKHQKEH